MIQRLSKRFWVIEKKLDDSLMNQLKQIIDGINRPTSRKMTKRLAGQLEDEYPIIYPTDVMNYINGSLMEYKDKINSYEKTYTTPTNYDIVKLAFRENQQWVNFQKKYEYNPFHRHSGDFSFVIWYKIPYTSEDEFREGPGQTRDNKNGSFSFLYDVAPGNIQEKSYKGDVSLEGTLLLFPANLPHIVYPYFSTDKERISFSGNLFLETDYRKLKKSGTKKALI